MPRWPEMTELERFEAKYIKAPSGCWIWIASINRDGYGGFEYQGKSCLAHRAGIQLMTDLEITGLEVDHLCRVRRCVNPLHLDPVPSQVNTMRSFNPAARNARKTMCVNGHPFNPENTIVEKPGRRRCRKCTRDQRVARYARLREAKSA